MHFGAHGAVVEIHQIGHVGVQGRHSVRQIPQQLLYGSTESTSASGKKFETNVTEYITAFNVDTRTLKISMNNAKFEEAPFDRSLTDA